MMSGLDPIPKENMAWDSYYRLYYDDDDFENSVYTPTAIDGDYDPDRENENTVLDQALDSDDDDTTPGTPAAASTPYQPGAAYHPGEEHEMTNLPQEQTGLVHGPGEPAWNALTYIYPDANVTDLEAFYDPKTQRL